jgi:DNA-directed RNA polymerase specialized sigma24 family protein
MGAPFDLEPAAWRQLFREVAMYARKFTRDTPRAMEIAQAAVVDAIDPERLPWDPSKGTVQAYLFRRVRSLYGNYVDSAETQLATEPVERAAELPGPTKTPLQLLLAAEADHRAKEMMAIVLILEDDDEDEFPVDADGNWVVPPNAEAASTRRARSRGYTDKEIKNARERLKRHAYAARAEYLEAHPP